MAAKTKDSSAEGAAPAASSEAAGPALAVEARGVSKIYRGDGDTPPVHALSDLTLEIPRGSLFGLLGPNGAGKSTFINILAGLVRKTTGDVRVWHYDVDRNPRMVRASIGIVPQELNYDPFFTPLELLEVQAGYYGVPKNQRRSWELLEAMGLMEKAHVNGRSLSGGQQRRLMIAKAMVHEPPILVLDEPTAGVDVDLRQQLYKQIATLKAQGRTILLTTHYLEEAQRLCDQIAIINDGKLVICETTETLLKRLDHKELRITLDRDLSSLPPSFTEFGGILKNARQVIFHYGRQKTQISQILDAIQAEGLTIADLSTDESDLEDIFLLLTGRNQDNQTAPKKTEDHRR